MAVEEVTYCHLCKVLTDCCECPECNKPTCENCFASQCPISVDPTTDCKFCYDEYELDREREWEAEKISTIRMNAKHSPVLRTLKATQGNCSRVVEILSRNGNARLVQVSIQHNFLGDPYFKIRLFNQINVDPWEKENRALK